MNNDMHRLMRKITAGDARGKRVRRAGFFHRADLWAFGLCFLLSFAVYFYTNAPTVTLEDSGELIVAADYLGVPHPPGYPVWTLLAWVFRTVLQGAQFRGYPNPAWAVGISSAFFGALACGLLALLVSRSGSDMVERMERHRGRPGLPALRRMAMHAGVTAGLLFAFSPVLWSQSTIAEVYSLNAAFFMGILVLLYRWMRNPDSAGTLWALGLVLGLGLTNHQTLLFLAPALVAAVYLSEYQERHAPWIALGMLLVPPVFIPLAVAQALFRRRTGLFRSFVFLGLILMALFFLSGAMARITASDPAVQETLRNLAWSAGPSHPGFWIWSGLAILFPLLAAGSWYLRKTFWGSTLFPPPHGRTAGITFLMILLGLSFYALLPLLSARNPPMNWGYTRTWEGFVHTVTRGQYDRIEPLANILALLRNPGFFLRQVAAMIFHPGNHVSVVAQFLWFISLLALVPFLYLRDLQGTCRHWLTVTFIGFLSLTVVFILFQFPQLDRLFLFVGRVQYIPAHALMALWIGYGLLFAVAALSARAGDRRGVRVALQALMLLLPLALLARNAFNQDFINHVGACDQRGHDFGWQFGYYPLRGAEGILSELTPQERAHYPNPAYPPAMGPGAILFGGTDPGRFVPTYMVFSAGVRPDVFVLTQNALADPTYLAPLRDLYGEEIWLPAPEDAAAAIQEYLVTAAGHDDPGALEEIDLAKVVIEGREEVMQVNAILARRIFEENRFRPEPDIRERFARGERPAGVRVVETPEGARPVREFYVEESSPIPWMYPYLEPHGLIMRLNPQPAELGADRIADDRAFWDWYSRRLLDNPKFHRDLMARKMFSSLRAAIAGLYAAREHTEEALYAYRQALALYPANANAYVRMAGIHLQRGEYLAAMDLMDEWLVHDADERVADYIEAIITVTRLDARRRQLEARIAADQPANLAEELELLDLYHALSMDEAFEHHILRMLAAPRLPAAVYANLSHLCVEAERIDLLEAVLLHEVEKEPGSIEAWANLASVQVSLGKLDDALDAAATALDLGGEVLRPLFIEDPRFAPLRAHPDFARRIGPPRTE